MYLLNKFEAQCASSLMTVLRHSVQSTTLNHESQRSTTKGHFVDRQGRRAIDDRHGFGGKKLTTDMVKKRMVTASSRSGIWRGDSRVCNVRDRKLNGRKGTYARARLAAEGGRLGERQTGRKAEGRYSTQQCNTLSLSINNLFCDTPLLASPTPATFFQDVDQL